MGLLILQDTGEAGELSNVWYQVSGLDVERGVGSTVVTAGGVEYLDFTSGIATTSTGHCHPHVVAAIQDQAARFIHAQVNMYTHPLLRPLARALGEVTPAGIDRFFFCNSGAEAVEAAVKLARQATHRPNVVVFDGGFHGRTAQTMAMSTAKTVYRAGYTPLPAGVVVAPFPHPERHGGDAGAATRTCLAAFDRLLATQTAPGETAAVVIEPVLGEGGFFRAPDEFLVGLAEICAANGILLVVDEVQTGFGRTGTMFAIERSGVLPDVLVMGKGIASGFPFAGIGASAALMDRWPRGSHGGTYGGSPLGCAAALATIEVLSAPYFLDEVAAKGEYVRGRLELLRRHHPEIGDVRGLGLMLGAEIVTVDAGAPDRIRAQAIRAHCQTHGHVIFMTGGTDDNVLRWMPPLVVTRGELDRSVDAFARALLETA